MNDQSQMDQIQNLGTAESLRSLPPKAQAPYANSLWADVSMEMLPSELHMLETDQQSVYTGDRSGVSQCIDPKLIELTDQSQSHNVLPDSNIHDQFQVAFHTDYESGTIQQCPKRLKSIQRRDKGIRRSRIDAKSLEKENQRLWELTENGLSWSEILAQFQVDFHKTYKSSTLRQRLKKLTSMKRCGLAP